MSDPIGASTQSPILPAVPWYRSEVQVRAVIAAGLQLVSIIARYIPGDWWSKHSGEVTADLTQIIAIVFALLAVMSRQTSVIQPLTITKAGAEAQAERAQLDPQTLEKKV